MHSQWPFARVAPPLALDAQGGAQALKAHLQGKGREAKEWAWMTSTHSCGSYEVP